MPEATGARPSCPPHYLGDGLVTCEDAQRSMLSAAPPWLTREQAVWWWQAMKYLWRWPLKGAPADDLGKCADCLRRLRAGVGDEAEKS